MTRTVDERNSDYYKFYVYIYILLINYMDDFWLHKVAIVRLDRVVIRESRSIGYF